MNKKRQDNAIPQDPTNFPVQETPIVDTAESSDKSIDDNVKVAKKSRKLKFLLCVIVLLCVISAIFFIFFFPKIILSQKIDSLTTRVTAYSDTNIPSQGEFDDLYEEYTLLSQKTSEIPCSDFFSRYEGVELDALTEINKKIADISSNTSFTYILNVKSAYDALNTKTKNLVDSNNLTKAFGLTTYEKAALGAAKGVRSVMKSQNSFSVLECKVKPGSGSNYFVYIKYSAQNSFGATLDKTSCLWVGKDYEATFLELAYLLGNTEKILSDPNAVAEYLKIDASKEERIDAEKIMYYLKNQ